MAKKNDETVPAGGGVDGERDPLTVGAVTHGEDIKGNSTFHAEAENTEQTDQEVAAEETVQAQEERAVDPAKAAAKKSK